MKKILFFCIGVLLIIIPKEVYALNEVNIYLFYSKTCSICEQERIYLQALKQDRYPNIRLYLYEVSDEEYYKLMENTKSMFNESRTGVPYTVIGDTPIFGFSQGAKGNFQNTVYKYSTQKYENKLGQKLGITYRTDLEGEVKEYKENSEYKIEESSGIQRKTVEEKDNDILKKYKSSIILISFGIILLIGYIILTVREYKKERV